ncbi:carbon starvation CstA family protein, partial [Yersinia pestis PY-60]
MAKITF